MTLAIDIETYSPVPIENGVYRYAEEAEVLLFAYSLDGAPVKCIDIFSGELLPHEVKEAIKDPTVVKTAFNANFERVLLRRCLKLDIPPEEWDCTQVRSIMLGLPFSLGQVAATLRLPLEKDKVGSSLIRYFSIPCTPTKSNGQRERNLPSDAPDKWQQFIDYCIKDVEVEQAVRATVLPFNIPDQERRLWFLDQHINDRGVLVDKRLVEMAMHIDVARRSALQDEAVKLTGLENPNSLTQLKQWLEEITGDEVEAITKKTLPSLIAKAVGTEAERMLEIRQELSRTSVAKYAALAASLCSDNRIHGTLQFYGASRTGRWAGRIFQPHNLPVSKLSLADMTLARDLVLQGEAEELDFLYGSVSKTLSELVRSALIAPHGKVLMPADFSQIEARVIAWLAGETWRIKLFDEGGDIYIASACQMLRLRPDEVTKSIRDVSKKVELAGGFGGGVGALERAGAYEVGLTSSELPELIAKWRAANPAIVALWRSMEKAAIRAVKDKTKEEVNGIVFHVAGGILRMRLPSGRSLSYVNPHIVEGKFGGDALAYEAPDRITRKWSVVQTYGGQLVENAVQAIARDCLADAMLRVEAQGFKIVFHVHDELVVEGDPGGLSVILNELAQPIAWAPGLKLKAEGEELKFYKK